MTFITFMTMLTICGIVTGLITEVEKKLITDFPANVIALITGIIVGGAVVFVYYFFKEIPYTQKSIMSMVLICLGSGFGSMVGYDKVIQTIKQIADKVKGE